MNRTLAFCSLFVLIVVVGCSNQPQLAEVSGTVTMNGKPINNVKVDFHPDADKGTTGIGSTGTTDDQGKFSLKYRDGAPGALVGHHRVVLTDLDVFGNVLVGRGDYRTESPLGPKETPTKTRFSATYSNLAQTPFNIEVKPGMSPVALEIKTSAAVGEGRR